MALRHISEHINLEKLKTMKASSNYFATLNQVNISEHLEKKGPYSYLSWVHAVTKLREFDETATWEVKRFNGFPFLHTELGYFVEVAVTVQGITLSQIHPVLDGRNRPILSPTPFDINTSIQRALVKAIGLHGLGLSVYAGEDLPTTTEVEGLNAEQQSHVQRLVKEQQGDLAKLLAYFRVNALSDIPQSEYERVLRALQRGRKEREAGSANATRKSGVAGASPASP
jgi:hypothetical protein